MAECGIECVMFSGVLIALFVGIIIWMIIEDIKLERYRKKVLGKDSNKKK